MSLHKDVISNILLSVSILSFIPSMYTDPQILQQIKGTINTLSRSSVFETSKFKAAPKQNYKTFNIKYGIYEKMYLI